MIRDIITVGPLVVWMGKPERTAKRLVAVARWRPRFPTVCSVAIRSGGIPAGPAGVTWDAITVTRMCDGTPINRTEYRVTEGGEIA